MKDMKRKYWLSDSIMKKMMDEKHVAEMKKIWESGQWDKFPVMARIFNASGYGTWELAWVEEDGDIAYGWCEIYEREFGPVSLSELKNIPYTVRTMIEIDMCYPGTRSLEK